MIFRRIPAQKLDFLLKTRPSVLVHSSQGRFFFCQKVISWIFVSKIGEQKVELRPPGPIWLHPGRNDIKFPGVKVPRSFMATHLVKIFSKNGTLEFPAPLAHFFLASVSVWNTQCLCGTHRSRAGRAGPGRAGRIRVKL